MFRFLSLITAMFAIALLIGCGEYTDDIIKAGVDCYEGRETSVDGTQYKYLMDKKCIDGAFGSEDEEQNGFSPLVVRGEVSLEQRLGEDSPEFWYWSQIGVSFNYEEKILVNLVDPVHSDSLDYGKEYSIKLTAQKSITEYDGYILAAGVQTWDARDTE